ncbi:MAG: hypothetical protein O7F12_09550 [Nitrospirae bacterium]|nr:hypothetical protein [Nitrospirota bacterium]
MTSLSISPANQPIFIVVVFVLALLALVLTLYNSQKIEQVATFYGHTQIKAFETLQDQVGDASANFAALEARIAKLENQGAAAPEVHAN